MAAILWVGEILIRRERRGVVALEKERLTLDAVMNGASDGIMVIDVNNRVNFANQRINGMLGARQGSLIAEPFQVVKDFIVARSLRRTRKPSGSPFWAKDESKGK